MLLTNIGERPHQPEFGSRLLSVVFEFEDDALIEEANNTIDYETHRNALLKLQAKIYQDQPYVFLYISKRKFAVHKRLNNRDMFYEFPGVMLNNLELNPSFISNNTDQEL